MVATTKCNGDHLRAGSPVVKQADILLQQEADPAAASEADDGGHTHIDVPAVHGERDIRCDDLRHDRINDHLDAVSACRRNRLQGAGLDALHLLGVKLGQRSSGMQTQRQCTCERTNPNPDHEDDHVDQGFDGAGGVEQCPRGSVDQ